MSWKIEEKQTENHSSVIKVTTNICPAFMSQQNMDETQHPQ